MIWLGIAALGVGAGQLHVARLVALVAFAALLFALSLGLYETRKQALRDETDAALEADFVRLERELEADERARKTCAVDEAES